MTSEKKLTLCEGVQRQVWNEDEMSEYDETVWMPIHKRIEQLLAEYFDIDLDKLELEKRAMLDELRRE